MKRLREPWFRVVAASVHDAAFYDERGVFNTDLYGFYMAMIALCRGHRSPGDVTPEMMADLAIPAKRRNRLLREAENAFLILENPPVWTIRNWAKYQDERLAKVVTPEQSHSARIRGRKGAQVAHARRRQTAIPTPPPMADLAKPAPADLAKTDGGKSKNLEINPSSPTPPPNPESADSQNGHHPQPPIDYSTGQRQIARTMSTTIVRGLQLIATPEDALTNDCLKLVQLHPQMTEADHLAVIAYRIAHPYWSPDKPVTPSVITSQRAYANAREEAAQHAAQTTRSATRTIPPDQHPDWVKTQGAW